MKILTYIHHLISVDLIARSLPPNPFALKEAAQSGAYLKGLNVKKMLRCFKSALTGLPSARTEGVTFLMRSSLLWRMSLISFLYIFSVCTYARDVQETVLQAHQMYEKGNTDKALELYRSIEQKGTATWYNMGNCYYKSGNYIDALICWKRAERTASWNELAGIYHNIDKANKALGIEHQSLKQLISRQARRYLSLLSLYGWQLFFLIVWILLLFLVVRLVRSRRYVTISSLSILMMVCATALYMKYELNTAQYAFVVEKNLTIYAGPDKGFHELGILAHASQISICEQHDEWLKVRSEGLVGWVPAETVTII